MGLGLRDAITQCGPLIPPFSVVDVSFASLQEEADYFRAQYESTVQKVEEIQAESREVEMALTAGMMLNRSRSMQKPWTSSSRLSTD